MPEITYRQALNDGLREELARDESVFLIGEDIGKNWGGAFQVTKGLAEEFGDDRVIDAPISENSFIGAAVGIDMYLTGETHPFWREDKEVDVSFDPDADPAPYPRAAMRLLSVAKRKDNFDEVELPWSESVTLREAKRCLRCDYREKTES